MVFAYFLTAEEMTLLVLETFDWHLRGVAFPPLPLLDDHQDLRLDFVLASAEEAAQDFPLPEIIQVVFYAIVLNDDLELRVLSRDLAEMPKSTFIGLRWSTFKVSMRRHRDNILRGRCLELDNPGIGVGPVIDRVESSGPTCLPLPAMSIVSSFLGSVVALITSVLPSSSFSSFSFSFFWLVRNRRYQQ